MLQKLTKVSYDLVHFEMVVDGSVNIQPNEQQCDLPY